MTVDTDHTYHVLAGATSVLVHNCEDGKLTDSARKKYEEIADSLPVRVNDEGETHGVIVDGNGKELSERIDSSQNYEYRLVNDLLRVTMEFDHPNRRLGDVATSSHVEAKVAYRMWSNRTKNADPMHVDVIINNRNGPCGEEGSLRCMQVVPYILPMNSTLRVWYRDRNGKLVSQPIVSKRTTN
ncbi:hypothetical protein B4N89_46405 [Embleya scabrispora]|uniref:Intein C-terminal splicing domain-containing protein n=1 Tax=Embleya scabrispora TaxID=159449 RepID=A0A1T3NIC9_9ACTN|nr:hypothetical protein B4N89_46405 [Embleya scabrispora]